MVSRILIVEDDARIASFLKRGLEAEGYTVELARDGEEALEISRTSEFALIILDRMLPKLDGLVVCQRLREMGCRSRILMLTAKDALQEKVEGLRSGADDYLTKPFAFDELLARVEALLRRDSPAEGAGTLAVGDLRLDLATKVAWRGERRIPLTAREFSLLACLMANADTVVSRAKLLSDVWKLNFDPGTKIIDVFIRYLRQKVDEGEPQALIHTVRGFGYMISSNGSSD